MTTITIPLAGVEIMLRQHTAQDENFIKTTFFHTMRDMALRCRAPSMLSALRLMSDFVMSFCTATVACSPSEPGLILGFCLHIAGAPVYFYSAKEIRRRGLCRALNQYTRQLGANGQLFNDITENALGREDRKKGPDVFYVRENTGRSSPRERGEFRDSGANATHESENNDRGTSRKTDKGDK